MARNRIAKDGTCRTRWTGLRNTAAEESINLCRIAQIDAPTYLAPARCSRGSRCGRRRRRAAASTTGVVAMPYLVEECEARCYAAYAPDIAVPGESGLVSLAVGKWQVGR